MKRISSMLGSLAFIVLALCAMAIVVSCTVWMVQSIMYAIW